jgi:thiamine transporter
MLQNIFDLFVRTVEEEGEITYNLTTLGYGSVILLILLILCAITIFSGSGKQLKVKQLIFASTAMALAMVTSFLKFGSLPFGGSITLFSMLFICYIGYLYGLKVGLMTGIAYGMLQFIIEPYLYHPMQVLLDYPLAFGCLGLAGIFHNQKYGLLKGYILGVIGRYLCHVISGYVFFRSWTPEGMNPWYYTITYNATYIVPEAIATIVLISLPPVLAGMVYVKKLATSY